MRCNKAQSYLSQELDEQLPADVTRDLDRHLDACAGCREYRADLALGQRLLAASEPELPENFDWRLQLRLNQALREAAGEHLFPWQEEERADRWAFLRSFGTATAVGLAAVLALAVVLGPEGARLPTGEFTGITGPVATVPASPIPTDRREVYGNNIFGGQPVSTGREVFGTPRTGSLLNRNWSSGFLDEGSAILYLRNEVRRLRTENFQQRRQLEALQTRLDTVPAASLDLRETR